MSTTPGPWIAVEGTRGTIYIVQQESRVRIATVDGWRNGPADAMLIAAAPALLEAAKLVACGASPETLKAAIAAAEAPYKSSGAENLSSEGIK